MEKIQLKRIIPIFCISVGLIGAFVGGYYLGTERVSQQKLEETTMLKERVIEYLGEQGTLLENSNLVFETIDHRNDKIVMTGMLRTTEPNRERVGRFWVELSQKDGKWIPLIVQTKTKSHSNSEDISWP